MVMQTQQQCNIKQTTMEGENSLDVDVSINTLCCFFPKFTETLY